MPPKVKFTREEIVRAALTAAREKGAAAVTAREVAAVLGASTRPIFTYFDTMDQLMAEVCREADERYRDYLRRGLAEPIPFFGVGRQYIRFAREEPELYKLLFLTRPGAGSPGAMAALRESQDLVRSSLMDIYHMDGETADCYFRDLWLVAFGFATLIVTDNCPYTEEQMCAVLTEVSLSVSKAYKEVPGLPGGAFDRDAAFRALLGTQKTEGKDREE